MTKESLTLRIVYALCLTGATVVHITIHAQFGVLLGALEAAGYSLATRVFWSSLTLLDPLAVVLLFTRARVGLVLTSAVIISDVAHNSWLVYRAGGTSDPKYWAQVAFLVFVLATGKIAWRGARS